MSGALACLGLADRWHRFAFYNARSPWAGSRASAAPDRRRVIPRSPSSPLPIKQRDQYHDDDARQNIYRDYQRPIPRRAFFIGVRETCGLRRGGLRLHSSRNCRDRRCTTLAKRVLVRLFAVAGCRRHSREFTRQAIQPAFAFNLRFPGQYFDSETGLHYNYFRDYDGSIGRYMQSDPMLPSYTYPGAKHRRLARV
jgi:RHS repeat-associated protein